MIHQEKGMPNWLDVNPRSGVPIYLQLVEQIKHALEVGVLQTVQQLPTVRQPASELTIAPNTMVTAKKESLPAHGQAAAIEIHDLVVKYGLKRAVDGLTFRVPAGTIFGFLGPNGSGKTTMIKTLLGFRPPDGGSARVLGYDVVSQSLQVRARVGYVSETNSLYDFLTIPQLCAFCRSLSPEWNQQVVDRYIGLFGLPPREKV